MRRRPDTRQRRDLGHSYERAVRGRNGDKLYAALVEQVALASTHRWRDAIGTTGGDAVATPPHRERPYFVLGASAKGFMRLRIATPWDWRSTFELRKLSIEPRPGGQPMIAWEAIVRRRSDGNEIPVRDTSKFVSHDDSGAAGSQGSSRNAAPRSSGYFALD